MTITKQEFLSEIKLIGGRGYGMFIETDSRRHTVETGDKILEVCSSSLTRNAYRNRFIYTYIIIYINM